MVAPPVAQQALAAAAGTAVLAAGSALWFAGARKAQEYLERVQAQEHGQ
jgi:hypothetical protein